MNLSKPPDLWPTAPRNAWEERAAIKQYHGGMPRQQAEDEAAEEIRAQNALAIPRERP
jgi:hypothetical protein